MVVKAIQIDNEGDTSFERNLTDRAQSDSARFNEYFLQNIKEQLKVDNGMFLR